MKQRIITGVIAGAGFLGFIILGGIPFIVLMVLLALIGMWELLRMKHIKPWSVRGLTAFLFLLLLALPQEAISFLHVDRNELFLLLIIVLLGHTVMTKNSFTFDEAGFVILASVYVGFGFHYFMYARFVDNGLTLIFFLLCIIWATDSGAYFVGRSMGKRKLWPEISPKKTIEGSIGGILIALGIGLVFVYFFPVYDSMITTIIAILLVSIAGQLGDLVESAFKRHYAVKDSGQVLPGHGGILDRFDSMIFVMPLFYLVGLM
ncbi:phosphatidate cytidylyltransferase [Paenalkalicoccus suaedae]|uniref:Phosphatidate cytidylyltransferase n=1 Tax=Paenalkalicoccus suaedae TaxID=2592382 RepID=A0A859FDG0_9BACI|nr:phosphatidate cytidylyltransferase [Paenalkalicoccus suaedae]QKS71403.1 phosphatidate cytidylyltransferase [Paenalkalicoccus suaedae]